MYSPFINTIHKKNNGSLRRLEFNIKEPFQKYNSNPFPPIFLQKKKNGANEEDSDQTYNNENLNLYWGSDNDNYIYIKNNENLKKFNSNCENNKKNITFLRGDQIDERSVNFRNYNMKRHISTNDYHEKKPENYNNPKLNSFPSFLMNNKKKESNNQKPFFENTNNFYYESNPMKKDFLSSREEYCVCNKNNMNENSYNVIGSARNKTNENNYNFHNMNNEKQEFNYIFDSKAKKNEPNYFHNQNNKIGQQTDISYHYPSCKGKQIELFLRYKFLII